MPKGHRRLVRSCQTVTGKKELNERVHECSNCGYQTDRDVAAAQVVVQRSQALPEGGNLW